MNLVAHFYQLNDDFSQEYADQHNSGNDSELNRRYDWEDELELTNDIVRVDVRLHENYVLHGEFSDGESFAEQVPDMLCFDAVGSDGSLTILACSHAILDSYTLDKLHGQFLLKVFINDYEPLSNPLPGVYVAAQDFPKRLIRE
jgi:hypothetical protein